MIVVNSNTRQFTVPGSDLVFGVTADSGSEVKYFQCPRYVGNNLDVASSFVRINYRNANGESDFYLVEDVAIDGDNVTFSWALSPRVTDYKGQVKFVMCVVGPDLKVKWHTTLGTGQVLEGMEPDQSHIEDETADVVAQLIAMVEQQTEAVKNTGAEQIAAVKAAAKAAETASVTEIEAKGENTRNSIPADYTALSAAVDALVRGRAGAIVCEAAGSAVAVGDASDNYIQGLRIFGRSIQDGTPTPEAPVEIVSVENPVVTVAGKNLFDGVIGTYAISQETVSAASAYVGFICPVAGGRTYTVSRDSVSSDRFRIAFTKIKPTSGTPYIGTSYSADTALSITAYAPEDATYLACYLSVTHEDVSGTHYQVELGDHATAYEPYKALQTVNLTHTLPGIPVTSGGNYTDENGQQWICDEVDLERGVYMQRVKTATYDGDEAWTKSGTSITCYLRTPEALQVQPMCNRLGPRTEDGVPYIRVGVTGDGVAALTVSLGRTEPNTVEVFKALLAEKPLNVLYALSKHVETPLSETEIAAYRALHSNYPNTTVLNDAGAHMVVKYAADTKLYIDNKIKEALQ